MSDRGPSRKSVRREIWTLEIKIGKQRFWQPYFISCFTGGDAEEDAKQMAKTLTWNRRKYRAVKYVKEEARGWDAGLEAAARATCDMCCEGSVPWLKDGRWFHGKPTAKYNYMYNCQAGYLRVLKSKGVPR